MSALSQVTIKLNNGVTMPQYGLGVWKCSNEEAEESVKLALKNGYRLIDTAAIYGNEEGCGRGIKDSGVPREEIFVTTKLWNTDQGFESTLKAFETSRKKLGLEYIDLYLIHFPRCDAIIAKDGKQYLDSWRAMEQLYAEKKVRAIGVSNFDIRHMLDLLAVCKVPPAMLQIELHTENNQKTLREFCAGKHIAVTAYSPLNQGRGLKNPTLEAIAKKHGKSTAQVILRWDIQLGIVTIPKSTHEKRIRENADIFDFELSPEEMEQINAMNINRRYNFDPEDPDAPKE